MRIAKNTFRYTKRTIVYYKKNRKPKVRWSCTNCHGKLPNDWWMVGPRYNTSWDAIIPCKKEECQTLLGLSGGNYQHDTWG